MTEEYYATMAPYDPVTLRMEQVNRLLETMKELDIESVEYEYAKRAVTLILDSTENAIKSAKYSPMYATKETEGSLN